LINFIENALFCKFCDLNGIFPGWILPRLLPKIPTPVPEIVPKGIFRENPLPVQPGDPPLCRFFVCPFRTMPSFIKGQDGEDCTSPQIPSPTENSVARIPEKFGSGNGANTQGNFPLKPLFLKNNRFNRKKTVQYRSVRKCAKTGPTGSLLWGPTPSGGRCGLKIKGVPSGPEIDLFFLKKKGYPPLQMSPVRHRRAPGIRDPPSRVKGIGYLLFLSGPGSAQPTASPAPPPFSGADWSAREIIGTSPDPGKIRGKIQ
jgi:hypothetical protein